MALFKSNQFALNIKTDRKEGRVNYSTNYHFIHRVWTPTFSVAEPILVSFRQLFPEPLMKTQSARRQMDAKFLPGATHSFYCEEATARTARRKPIKPARHSSCAHSAFPPASLAEKKPGWLLAASPQNLDALNEMWQPILTRPQKRNCFSSV